MATTVTYWKDQRYDKLKKNLEEQQTLFCDNSFPTSNASLGTAVDALMESDTVEWKRPKDLSNDPKLFLDGPSALYIVGGQLSSFWFLQSLQILAGMKELLFKVMVNCGEQEWQKEFPEKYSGLFRFKFWRFGQWTEVVVDDHLPCLDGKLLFCHSLESSQFWPSLLEKAYAKVLGSYGALEHVHISDVLVDLTGGVSEIIDLRAMDNLTVDEELRSSLFQSLSSEMTEHSIICASIAAEETKDLEQTTLEGLSKGRMYQLTALRKIHLGDIKLRTLFKNREKVAVIRLRDTRGSQNNSPVSSPTKSIGSSPEGDSPKASQLTASQLTKMLSRNPAWSRLKDEDRGRFGLVQDHESEVWMPFEDFTRYYHEVIIVRMYNNNIFTSIKKWKDESVRGQWTEGERGTPMDRSGGGNLSTEHFLRNPQYFLDVSSDEEEIVMQLLQWDGSEPSPSATSETSPYSALPVSLTVVRVEVNRKYRLHRQWGFTPTVIQMDHQRRREIYYRGTLTKGRYIVVPTAFKPLSSGHFLLRIISRHSLSLREAVKDIPTELCGLSCIASPALWVTVLTIKGASGLPVMKHIYCKAKCEKQSAKTSLSGEEKEVTWDDAIIFYRRKPERPICIKVYRHNTLSRNQLLGMVELQARVNHSPTTLEVTLLDEKRNVISDRTLHVQVLTEDDLMSV